MKIRVLCVEDDVVQAQLIKTLLEDEGFSVFHVCNGFDALQVLQSTLFDVVLTDFYMPNMNGIELMQAISERGYQLPAVVMTAANDVSLAFSALNTGAEDFISKDAAGSYLSIIGPVLHRALDKHQLQRRTQALAQALEDEKNLSYKTLDSLTQGVIVLDQQYSVKYCNSFFRSLFGVSQEQGLVSATLHYVSELVAKKGAVDGAADPKIINAKLMNKLQQDSAILEIEMATGEHLEIKSTVLENVGYALTVIDITHQKQQLFALDRTITFAPVAMMAVNVDGRIVLANQRACAMIGLPQKELLKRDINELVPPQFRHGHHDLIKSYFHSLEPRRMREGVDLQLLDKDGKEIPVEISLSGIEISGQPQVLATIVDISHRKKAEQALLQAHQLTQSIIDNSPFSIIATDVDGLIVAASPALEKLLWYDKNELVGQHNAVDFHEAGELESRADLLSAELAVEVVPGFQVLVEKARRGLVEGQEWTYIRKDGSRLPVNLTVTTLRSEGNMITGYLLVAYDITEQKRANEYIEHIAHHDALTGLPNRSLMQDRLQAALMRCKRYGNKVGVLVLDLDHFKRINDSLGHLAGDQLLKTIAQRLCNAVRESDTVARMGGDEFVVILPDIHSSEDAEQVCEKILMLVSKPINVGLNNLNVTPSIGLSIAPEDGADIDELLKHADIAMYRAKQAGRNGFQSFCLELAQSNLEDMAIEQALHQAYQNHQLTVHYQPQVDAQNNKVVGFEALMRWFDLERGAIAPDRFIPMAETTGFIVTLGEWVLQRACNDISQLCREYGVQYKVAVNISPRQFEQANFVSLVSAALKRSALPPQCLQLEITEGLLVSESNTVLSKLSALKQLGVALAIDDFGTGYSSLSYVAKYPIDVIKIDRAFMDISQKSNVAIVSAVTAIASGLDMTVIAEGVETLEQIAFVQQRGCHLVQGFYYSKAVDVSDLSAVMRKIAENKVRSFISKP